MFKKNGFENADKIIFTGGGYYDIPKINGFIFDVVKWQGTGGISIGFNYCKSCITKNINCEQFLINCYQDDYQFVRLWNRPDAYIEFLKKFKVVCSPDFSLYTDHPKALQIWNHYRKHWLGAYWESKGIKVIPTICWSDSSSFDWCFDGEPQESIVAISTKGTQRNAVAKERFLAGYNQMIKRLKPIKILLFGNNPGGLDGEIIEMGYMSADMIKSSQMS